MSERTGQAPDQETTYDQVNKRCREISWPGITAFTTDCKLKVPGDNGENNSQFGQQFWNNYVYPGYEQAYFRRFPEDRTHKRDINILDYNRKMVLALCDWIEENGYFHCFEDRIVFLKYDAYGLSMGDLLCTGPPILEISAEQQAYMLNRFVEENAINQHWRTTSVKWVGRLAIASAILLAILLVLLVT